MTNNSKRFVLYCECADPEPIIENDEVFCKKCSGFTHLRDKK